MQMMLYATPYGLSLSLSSLPASHFFSKLPNQAVTEEMRTAGRTETLSRKPLSSLGYPRPHDATRCMPA